jgi:hypothetical protein
MTAATVVVLNAAQAAQPTLTELVLVGGAPSGQQRGSGWRRTRFGVRQLALPPLRSMSTPVSASRRRTAGAGDRTPIVFLHGGGMTLVSWAPYAQTLSSRDRRYSSTLGRSCDVCSPRDRPQRCSDRTFTATATRPRSHPLIKPGSGRACYSRQTPPLAGSAVGAPRQWPAPRTSRRLRRRRRPRPG